MIYEKGTLIKHRKKGEIIEADGTSDYGKVWVTWSGEAPQEQEAEAPVATAASGNTGIDYDGIAAQIDRIRKTVNEITPKVQEISAQRIKETPENFKIEEPQDMTPYSGITAGASSAIETYTKNMQDLMKSFTANAPEPVDTEEIYDQLADQFGLEKKQEAANAKQELVNTAINNLNNINAKIQAVNDEATAASLQLEKNAATGSDITSSFLGRQQTEISRNAAIKALPLQSSALVASAKVSAAQGDQQLAQDQLNQAQDNIARVFSIQAENAKAKYEYKMDLYKSVFSFATDIQKTQLEAMAKQEDRAYASYQDNLKTAQGYAQMAIQTGQGSLATSITQLDPNSPDFQSELAGLVGQIQTPEEDVKTSIVNVNGRSVLINTQTGEVISDLGIANSEISGGGTGSEKIVYSGNLETTQGEIAQAKSALESGDENLGIAGRGQDGYADTNSYISLYKTWIGNGGTTEDFIKNFPPANYLNPNDPILDAYPVFKNKLKTSSSVEGDIDNILD